MQLTDVLLKINKGATVAELCEKFRDLVQAVRSTSKAGTFTLTLRVAPATRGEMELVTVEAGTTVKAPEQDRHKNIFFVNDDGELFLSDPNQMELPLRPRAVEVVSKEVFNG